jgi:hypothetical protein
MYSFEEGDGGGSSTSSEIESSERSKVCPSETTESLSESIVREDMVGVARRWGASLEGNTISESPERLNWCTSRAIRT